MPLLHTKTLPPFQENLDLQIELAGKVIRRGITTGLSSSSLPQASAIAPYQTGCGGRWTTFELKDSQKSLLSVTGMLEFLPRNLHTRQNPMGRGTAAEQRARLPNSSSLPKGSHVEVLLGFANSLKSLVGTGNDGHPEMMLPHPHASAGEPRQHW